MAELATDAGLRESEVRLDACFAEIENDLFVIKWMMGFVLAFQVGIFVKLFVH